MLQRLLLGPQRPVINLDKAVAGSAIPEGPVAVISAGWQEAEGDIDDVRALVPRELIDLNLYHRADKVFADDPKLHAAYRDRQSQLTELQRLYRLRLRQLMLAARQLRRSGGNPDLVAGEERHAISQVRSLDRHHLGRINAINAAFADGICTRNSEALSRHVTDIETALAKCPTVLLTGGNVIVLLNRLRLFGVDRLLAGKHLIAWSAGVMVLSDLIVLYHDKTPNGRRDPELFSSGAGVLPGYVFLPDAGRRLKVNDAVRISLFSRRFAPATCVAMDNGSVLHFEGARFRHAEGARTLTNRGRLAKVRVP